MKKINSIMLKTIIYMIICYVAHTISDDFISGGIAMAMCLTVGEFIDEKSGEENK